MAETSMIIVGSGGREHAVAQATADAVGKIYGAPGNLGFDELRNGNRLPFGASDTDKIVAFAVESACSLVFIGPEQPLVDGLADRLRGRGISVFGPGAEAAKLEGSKAFGIEFMKEFGIRHAASFSAYNYNQALPSIRTNIASKVLKADGLAAGKGVELPESFDEADSVLRGMFSGELFGGAGKDCVVIQERLHGPEISVMVVTDGERFAVLPYSQDHKRLKDNDEGPNTGGMGAYAPVPASIVSPQQKAKIDKIIEKSIYGIRQRGMDYRGVLYIGMMLAEEYQGDPVVLEYNVRFGDPETQVILPLTQRAGVDTYGMLKAVAEGRLHPGLNHIAPRVGGAALTYCLAAEGYPASPITGQIIHGLDQRYPGVTIQHGGTKRTDDGKIVSGGGRVLWVTGSGKNVKSAARKADNAIGEEGKKGIYFDKMQRRHDIGHQARTA